MRMRYTFEILAMGLLMAAGSILRPAVPAPAYSPLSAAPAAHATVAVASHLTGGRG